MKTAQDFERMGVHGAARQLTLLNSPSRVTWTAAGRAAADATTVHVCSGDDQCDVTR
jgi:hypothetical protein